MDGFWDYVLLLLAQFAGGPGPKENNLVRFGLPAILWAALLIVAWTRQRQQDLPREKLLVWGFGLGLTRELFMFSHVSVSLMGAEEHSAGYFAPEPIEHALTMAAIVMVAGAFIRYILNDAALSRRYLWVGLSTTAICYVVIALWWSGHTAANPTSRFNQSSGGFYFHAVTSVFTAAAIFLIAGRRGWLRNTVLVALGFFFLGEFLRVFNFSTDRVYTDFCCPVANSFHIWAIPMLGYVYLREQSIEKRQAEEALEAYREHLEELVEERTTELTTANEQLQREVTERKRAQAELAERNTALAAQNTIAATTSQSLDLDRVLNTVLDPVTALLEIEAACVFLLDADGETLVLQTYRGQVSPGELTEQTQMACLCEEISERAVKGMEPVVLKVTEFPRECQPPQKAGNGLQVMVSTPLVASGRALGALTLGTRRPRAFPPHELELLTAIGQQIGVAVENARLYRETERWAEELALLHEVSIFLTSTFDPETIYNQVAEQSAKLLGCEMTLFFHWSEERREAVEVASYGTNGSGIDGLHMLLGESDILVDLVTHRDPVAIADAQDDLRVSHLWREKFNVGALLCLPVWGKGKPLGFLCMIERRPRRWRLDEVQLVESFINRAAVAIENAQLHRQLEWAAALEERQRIAADMHDGLAQMLSYMGHRVDWMAELAENGQAQEMMDECQHMRNTIDQAAREVRQTIASLGEAPRPRQPLQDQLAEIAEKYPKGDGPRVILEIEHQDPLLLPPNHLEQVLRVAQEAIGNADRHAEAEQITVRLEERDSRATLTVEDDGRGFDPDAPPTDDRNHFGLSIMRARAARIGGYLEVDSAAGQGTRVRLTWSLDEVSNLERAGAQHTPALRPLTPKGES